MARTFDRSTLDLLDRAMEVRIETFRMDGMPRRATIWLVVDGDEVFIRSWMGDRGHWYQNARENPDQVTLIVGQRTIPARVVWTDDDVLIDRCSRALQSKYRGDPATPSMVRPDALGTTLRVEPR